MLITKLALESMTRSWALELADSKVRVNAISVGNVETPVLEHAGLDPETAAKVAAAQVGGGSVGTHGSTGGDRPLGGGIGRAARDARLPARELAVLRRVPLFAGLPGLVLENLAFRATPARLAAGDVLMRQGDPGDRYYAIASGQLNVSVDGVELAQKGPGDGVGEIALLRAVPRIATVAAIEDAELLAIEREPFLAAVTGHAAALEDANAIVAAHMAGAALARRAA